MKACSTGDVLGLVSWYAPPFHPLHRMNEFADISFRARRHGLNLHPHTVLYSYIYTSFLVMHYALHTAKCANACSTRPDSFSFFHRCAKISCLEHRMCG